MAEASGHGFVLRSPAPRGGPSMHIAIQTTSPPASARQRQNKVLAGRILFGLAIAAVWQWAGTSTGLAAWISNPAAIARPEEHTSELQSLMRNPCAVFCL